MIVSVIVPVKDDCVGLGLTLESLPTDGCLEIIVIDGGSSADTMSVIRSHERRLAYWESGLDTGIADAMNRGLTKATGTYVAILNAGDAWLPDTLERVVEAIGSHPEADIHHGTIEYVAGSTATHRVEPDVTRLSRRMYVFHPTMFVRRTTYEEIGGYDADYAYAMDSEWCHRALKAQKRFHTIPGEPLARMSLGGRSDKNFRLALLEYRRSVTHHGLASHAQAQTSYLVALAGKWINGIPALGWLARALLGRAMGRTGLGSPRAARRDSR